MDNRQILNKFDTAPLGSFHYITTSVAGLGWVWVAFCVAIAGFILPNLRDEWGIQPAMLGLMGSVTMAGMLVGSIIAGSLADHYGRKRLLEIALVEIAALSIISAFSWNFTILLFLRFLLGLGLGAVLPPSSTLISEYSPVRYRGAILVLLNGFWGLGVALAALVGYSLIPRLGWQVGLAFGGLVILNVPLVMRFLPESLRFLMEKNRSNEIQRVLNQTRAVSDPHDLGLSRLNVPLPGQEGEGEKTGIWSLRFRVRTAALWMLWFALNFMFQGIFIWLPSLLIAKGNSVANASLLVLVISLGQIPGAIIAAFFVDKAGRRKSMGAFLALYGITAFLIGLASTNIGVLVWGFTASMCNGATWGMAYPFTTEQYPTRIRAAATGWANGFGRAGGILAPFLIGWLIQLGAGNLVIFSVLGTMPFLALTTLLGLRRETSGQVLEEASL